jgi:hypothetical protein
MAGFQPFYLETYERLDGQYEVAELRDRTIHNTPLLTIPIPMIPMIPIIMTSMMTNDIAHEGYEFNDSIQFFKKQNIKMKTNIKNENKIERLIYTIK